MAHVGEEVQRTGPRISEVSGETPEKKIWEVVLGAKIEDHVVYPDRGITVEAIEKPKDIPQHKEPGSLSIQRSRRKVMDHPCPLIGPEDGDMSIDASVFLAGEVGFDLLIFLVESTVGFLEILEGGLEEMVFLGVDEACVE
jgi:hypothetical protein